MLTKTSIDTAKKLYDVISKDRESEIWTVSIPCYGMLSLDDILRSEMAAWLGRTARLATAEEIINSVTIYEVTLFIAARLQIEWEYSDTLNLPMSLYSRFLACLNEERLGGEGRFFSSIKSIEKVLV